MSDMYFFLEPNKIEKGLVDYITYKVDEVTKKSSNALRYQKIVINIARKLGLPITRFWFHMGEMTPYVITSCTLKPDVLSIVREDLPQLKLEELDKEIEVSSKIFTADMSGDEIRDKQYSLYSNTEYLCLLEIVQLLKYGFKENCNEILLLFSSFLNLIPRTSLYLDFYDKFFEYVISTKKLVFSKCSISNESVSESFNEFLEYFTNLKGIETAQGYLSEQVKRKIRDMVPQSKYRIIGTLNQLKEIYDAKVFPELSINNDLDKDGFSTFLQLESVCD